MTTVVLPVPDGKTERYTMGEPRQFETAHANGLPRVAYAAAHVVADPTADCNPWLDVAIDWEATIDYRRYLWSLGLGVAEGMDTAQRGTGVDWPSSLELIRRSVDAARDFESSNGKTALLVNGAGTDHLVPGPAVTIDDVIRAYEDQCEAIESAGGRIVLMASRGLAIAAKSADDYHRVYARVLAQVREPVILHWLGEMFDPALTGYWGHDDLHAAMDVCIEIIEHNRSKVDGIKISLLDDQMEIRMRGRLPRGVRMYTGDDFNFPSLIAGGDEGYSDALLGIFDAIAPAASAALGSMARQDMGSYWEILESTLPLSRHMFAVPTRFYKTGVVFLAYLNGHQSHFTLVGGLESARSTLHFAELFRLADTAGLLRDPDISARRMADVLAVRGIGA